jgi:hypothetical protein
MQGQLITTLPKAPKRQPVDLNFCWKVQFEDGHFEYFTDEESAKACAAMYGIGISAPLYR